MFILQTCLACQDLPTLQFEVNLSTHFGVIALFRQIFKMLIPFVLYFKNYKR